MAVPSSAADGEDEDEDDDGEDHKPVGGISPPKSDSFPTYHDVDRSDWRKQENPNQMPLHGDSKPMWVTRFVTLLQGGRRGRSPTR